MFSYIHIPFCESKCKYCRFASTWKFQDLQIKKYINFLLEEIDTSPLTPLLKGEGNNKLESIYFGWWTPTTLNSDQLDQIIKALENKFWFKKNIEISLESTPSKITKENLEVWKNIWVNRLSIWVQTLNNKALEEIWRGNKGDIIKSLDNIKKVWFDNVSIDFIIWLPYIKKWDIKKDLEYILDNYDFIKHISVYMLEEYYYPWNWEDISIKEEDYLWEYEEVVNFLEERWFNRYEVSNFAGKPSHQPSPYEGEGVATYECKHNKAYWNHTNITWFWLAASSFIDNTRLANSDKFEWYYKWEFDYKEKLNKEDIFIEKVMFALRTKWLWLDLVEKLNKEKLEEFIKDWYLKKENDLIKLENKGVLVLDYILSEII